MAVPAAEWVCELMWERLRLFLEVDAPQMLPGPLPNPGPLTNPDHWS